MSATTRYIDAIDRSIVSLKAGGHWEGLGTALLFVGGAYENCTVPIKRGMPLPESFNFTAGDWRRAEGLQGDGAAKYVDLKYNNNADPQNDQSMGVWVSWPATTNSLLMGVGGSSTTGATHIVSVVSSDQVAFRNRSSTSAAVDLSAPSQVNFIAMSRSSSGEFVSDSAGVNNAHSVASQSPYAVNIDTYRNNHGSPLYTDARLAIVFAGRSDDLAALRAIFTALIDDIKTVYYNLPTGNLVASYDFSDGVQGWDALGAASVAQDDGRLVVTADGSGGAYRWTHTAPAFTDWGVGARIRVATKARTLDGDSYTVRLRNSSSAGNWADRSGDVLSLTPTLTDFVTEFTIASTAGAMWYQRSAAHHYAIHNIDIRRIG